jgi:hypothetical protein
MKLGVMSAMNYIVEAWRVITPTPIKNYFVMNGSLIDVVNINCVKLNEDEEDDWHSL